MENEIIKLFAKEFANSVVFLLNLKEYRLNMKKIRMNSRVMIENGMKWSFSCAEKFSLPYLIRIIKKSALNATAKSTIKIKNILNCMSKPFIFMSCMLLSGMLQYPVNLPQKRIFYSFFNL